VLQPPARSSFVLDFNSWEDESLLYESCKLGKTDYKMAAYAIAGYSYTDRLPRFDLPLGWSGSRHP